MAIKSKLLSVALNTVTGNQAITGVGFQPDFIIGMASDMTATGGAANQNMCMFASKGSAQGLSSSWGMFDSQTSNAGASNYINQSTPMFRIYTGDALILSANLVSIDADGLTINILTAPSAAYILHILAFQDDSAGAIQFVAGNIDCNTVVGNQDVTGLGFNSPDLVMFIQGYARTTAGGAGSGNLSPNASIGFAAGGTQAAIAYYEQHGANPGNTKRAFRSDRCFHMEGSSTLLSFSYVAGITDGFRINIATTAGATYRITYFALKGVSAKVLNVVSSTGTGPVAVMGAGFTPSATIALTVGTTVETLQDNARMGIGFATATARIGIAAASLDNILGSSNVSEKYTNTAALIDLAANHGSPTDTNRWDVDSLDSDGLTYNHEVADGAATKLAFLVIGPASSSNQTLTPTGIASSAVFGTTNVFSGSQAQTISPIGIVSAAAFGVPVIGSAKILQPSGIKSSDSREVELTGTFDDVAFNSQFTQYKVELVNGPDPRSAFFAFGTSVFLFTPVVAPGDYLAKLSLSNSTGSVLANTVTFPITVTNFGKPAIVVGGGGGAHVLQPVGIASSESFGNVFVNMAIVPTGIASLAAFGTPTMALGGQSIIPAGIPSSEAFGTVDILNHQVLLPVAIPSSEEFGNTTVVFEGGQVINIQGIETSEAFGTTTMSIPVTPPTWPPIQDPHTVWTRIAPGKEG